MPTKISPLPIPKNTEELRNPETQRSDTTKVPVTWDQAFQFLSKLDGGQTARRNAEISPYSSRKKQPSPTNEKNRPTWESILARKEEQRYAKVFAHFIRSLRYPQKDTASSGINAWIWIAQKQVNQTAPKR